MIQRIQTVYFLLAALLAASTLFGTELFSFTQGDVVLSTAYKLTRGGEFTSRTDFWMLTAIQVVFALMIIFSFKQRQRQLFLGWVLFLLNILTTVWMLTGLNVYSSDCADCTEKVTNPAFGFVFYLHAIACIFALLGILAVRKDKKIIDSLNRLR